MLEESFLNCLLTSSLFPAQVNSARQSIARVPPGRFPEVQHQLEVDLKSGQPLSGPEVLFIAGFKIEDGQDENVDGSFPRCVIRRTFKPC
jgi:hypothetical protein